MKSLSTIVIRSNEFPCVSSLRRLHLINIPLYLTPVNSFKLTTAPSNSSIVNFPFRTWSRLCPWFLAKSRRRRTSNGMHRLVTESGKIVFFFGELWLLPFYMRLNVDRTISTKKRIYTIHITLLDILWWNVCFPQNKWFVCNYSVDSATHKL